MNRKYRKTVIAGNWKMNKTPSETKEFMTEFKTIMPKGRWCDVALCVPAVCIPAAVRAQCARRESASVRRELQRQRFRRLYRRDCREHARGRGLKYVILGHPSAAPWARRTRM